MAALNSDGVQNTSGNVKTMIQKDSMIWINDRYTYDGSSETTSDTITMRSIPAGYACIAAGVTSGGVGFGTSCTVDLGISGATTALISSVNVNTADAAGTSSEAGVGPSASAQPLLLTVTGVGAVPSAGVYIDVWALCVKTLT